MKSSEIEVGKKYSMGYNIGALVLETRVARTTDSGCTRCDGVRVKVFEGYRAGREQVVASRDIQLPWEEHQEIIARSERERAVRLNDARRNQRRLKQLVDKVQQQGIQLERSYASSAGRNITSSIFSATLTMDSDQLEKLVALIETTKPNKTEPAPIASASALEKLFG